MTRRPIGILLCLILLFLAMCAPSALAERGYRFSDYYIKVAVCDALGIPCERESALPYDDVLGVTKLDLSGMELTDISDLAGMTGLLELDLRDNEITDVRPLAGLYNLEKLLLDKNLVADVLPMFTLIRRGCYISLAQNPAENTKIPPDVEEYTFTNISVEKAARSRLDIPTGMINNYDIRSITEFGLPQRCDPDMSDLAGFTGLRKLTLNRIGITDISPLAGLTGLAELDVSFNDISDISPLMGLTGLADLNLGGNRVTDISPLAGLRGLKR